MPKSQEYNVENIRVQVSHRETKCLTRISTDLCKTGNKEVIEDLFRLPFDDITVSRDPISIKAYDICYSLKDVNGDVPETEAYIGEAKINQIFIRENFTHEMIYQCAISIDLKHFSNKVNQEEDSFLKDNKEEEDMIRLIDNIGKDVVKEKLAVKKTPELILNFNIVFLTTPFTRNPLGILSFNEITLLNY